MINAIKKSFKRNRYAECEKGKRKRVRNIESGEREIQRGRQRAWRGEEEE